MTLSDEQALIDAHMAAPHPQPPPPLAAAEEEDCASSKRPLPPFPSSSVATVGSTIATMAANANANSARQQRFNRAATERYGSVDSSDTFLSCCNTPHPFPSQGSLAGLEELAARGTMAANGSMPAVNISGINRSVRAVNCVIFNVQILQSNSQASWRKRLA